MEGVLQEKGAVLQGSVNKAPFFRLVKLQLAVLGPLQQGFPIYFGGEDQAEVAGVDTLLGGEIRADMGHQLVAVKVQN